MKDESIRAIQWQVLFLAVAVCAAAIVGGLRLWKIEAWCREKDREEVRHAFKEAAYAKRASEKLGAEGVAEGAKNWSETFNSWYVKFCKLDKAFGDRWGGSALTLKEQNEIAAGVRDR